MHTRLTLPTRCDQIHYRAHQSRTRQRNVQQAPILCSFTSISYRLLDGYPLAIAYNPRGIRQGARSWVSEPCTVTSFGQVCLSIMHAHLASHRLEQHTEGYLWGPVNAQFFAASKPKLPPPSSTHAVHRLLKWSTMLWVVRKAPLGASHHLSRMRIREAAEDSLPELQKAAPT